MNMRVENPDKNYRRRIMVTVLLISIIFSLSVIIVIAVHLSERKEATSARGVWRYASVSADRGADGKLYNIYHGYGYAPPCTPMPVQQLPSYNHTSTYAWTRQRIKVYINNQWVDDPPELYVDIP
ncbi:MAG: hypothetical protein QW304_01315 [Thermoproteota archaeon]